MTWDSAAKLKLAGDSMARRFRGESYRLSRASASIIGWLVLHLIGFVAIASAQEAGGALATPGAAATGETAPPAARSGDNAPSSATGSSQPRVHEVDPPIYYLPDDRGKLQAVLGFTLEDFERLYRLQEERARASAAEPQRPRYSLQQIEVEGRAEGDQAQLNVHISIQLRDADWVRIPLQLDRALLQSQAEYEGPGEHYLTYEADHDGYVCWMRGPRDSQHQLTLRMVAPLISFGGDSRLRLTMPPATSSQLRLQTPLADAVAQVSDGAVLQQSAPADGTPGTLFTVFGATGAFELRWSRAGGNVHGAAPVLDATSVLRVALDGRSIESQAAISVRSFGGPFDAFRVQLPPGAELVPGSSSGYVVEPVAAAEANGPRQIEVRLAQKTSGPVEVRLNTRAAAAEGAWWELAGFDVLGAARQAGRVGVAVTGDWQVLWGTSLAVRQIDLPSDITPREDVIAAFEYFAQPFSLPARLVRPGKRISVEPEYRVRVSANRAELEATLRYFVRGAKVSEFQVDLSDWDLDDVLPEGLVAWGGVEADEARTWTIPLLSPVSGAVELKLKAHRDIPDGAGQISFSLPQPRDATVSPATLAVTAADNVNLLPDAEAIDGLVRESSPPADAGGGQFFYRGEPAGARFAAEFKVQPQKIQVRAATRVELNAGEGRVEQRFRYTIAYEPADSLLLHVPESMLGSDTLQVSAKGIPLATVPIAGDLGSPAVSPLRVLLPAPAIGDCELTISYPIGVPAAVTTQWTPLTVPLVEPADEIADEYRAEVTAPEEMELAHLGSNWRTIEDDDFNERRQLLLGAAVATDRLELGLRRGPARGGGVVIDEAFVQTWCAAGIRQDRAVFNVVATGDRVTVALPADAIENEISITVDGAPAVWKPLKNRQYLIRLRDPSHAAENAAPRPSIVEIRYQLPQTTPSGRCDFKLPHLVDEAGVRRLYWQLVLPPQEHLLIPPAGMLPEYVWRWSSFGWRRHALLEQADLEHWSGAPPRAPLPPDTNRYLFSTFGPVAEAQAVVVRRSTIVLLGSGLALLIGLGLVYVPALRHPATALAAALVLLTLGLIYPEPVLLLSQAALLGGVLAALAGALKWLLARRAQALPLIGRRALLPSELAEATRTTPPAGASGAAAVSLSASAPAAAAGLTTAAYTPPSEPESVQGPAPAAPAAPVTADAAAIESVEANPAAAKAEPHREDSTASAAAKAQPNGESHAAEGAARPDAAGEPSAPRDNLG